jgi:hypothetical protein
MSHDHFKGKDAVSHVAEARADGIVSANELHGTEIPGHISAFADSARDTLIAGGGIILLFRTLNIAPSRAGILLGIFFCGWALWKMGRSAWLGWSRLERLHRVLAQEKWEIEHNRQQEREELGVLYAAKGFEGKLLEDVLDVLMADGDRLLKVMVEEELGLTLESQVHPLKQGIGAGLGVCMSGAILVAAYTYFGILGMFAAGGFALILSAWASAKLGDNLPIPAIVWNLGLAVLSLGFIYFLLQL